MPYQSLYRRYRPTRFAEVRGQEHMVRALQNAVRDERVSHAYLLSGPRGTGKTSTARILAKVLNCLAVEDVEPCGTCDSCVAIERGSSFDVHELDAASNNGVEAVRELTAKAALATPGRTKVYILDEVHMLSPAASNALLKTLEEPPEHVVFVLATTDPQKVLPTIRSRTQHFEVRLLPAADLEALVDFVVADAGLSLTPDGREYVLRAGGGSARDTLTALERVASTGGVAPGGETVLDDLVEALCDRDTARALAGVEEAVQAGSAPRALGDALISRLRDVFLVAVGTDISRLSDGERALVAEQARRLTAAGATRALELLGEAFVGIQDAPDPRVVLEVALVRLTRPDADLNLAAVLDRIGRLERAIAEGSRTEAPPDVAGDASREVDAPVEVAGDRPDSGGAEARPSRPEPRRAPAGGRPADSARQVLAERMAAGQAVGGTPPRRRRETPSPSASMATPATAPEPPTPMAASPKVEAEPQSQGISTSDSAMPTRDDLTLAWGDSILPVLGRARARYAAGRWVDVDAEGAVFALPNAIHVAKCEEVRDVVESALADHFGTRVPIRIVVDGSAGSPPPQSKGGPTDIDPHDDVDLDDLTDAVDVAVTGVERVTQAFPGAELVRDDAPSSTSPGPPSTRPGGHSERHP